MPGRLAGKVAVVVGAGQTPGETIGNGRACAMAFAREGAAVLVVDRDDESAADTRQRIEDEGGRAEMVVADVSDPAAPAIVLESARGYFGGVDVLHNNVGISGGDSAPTTLDEDYLDRILDVNLKGTWRMCKHIVPTMCEAGRGSVICMSSMAVVAAGGSNVAAYKMAKAAVHALVHALAVSSAPRGVRVNAIMPGLIDTPMAVDEPAAVRGISRQALADTRARSVPLGRQGTAWDVANAALFLASEEASFVTGVVLSVDGGQSLMVG